MRRTRPLLPLLLLVPLLIGCPKEKGPEGALPPPRGPVIPKASDLAPTALPKGASQLVYSGTQVPVEVRRIVRGKDVEFELVAHEEVVERETYRSSPETFALVRAAGETYDPPVTLLQFPLTLGSTWDWKGKMTTGGLPRQATAKVETTADRLFEETVPLEAVQVTVNLTIDANGPDGPPAERKLVFWFAKEGGIVRREFGMTSVREPLKQD